MGRGHSREVHYVTTVVEKVINPTKDKFEADQKWLANLLEKHRSAVVECGPLCAVIGPAGIGKSTLLNYYYGCNFEARASALDVTTEITMQQSTTLANGITVADSVGTYPNLTNVCKMLLLFIVRGWFPKYFIYVTPGRIVGITPFGPLIEGGFIKATVVPFDANLYYLAQRFGRSAQEAAMEAVPHLDVIGEMKTFIRGNGWDATVKLSSPAEHPVPQEPISSMKEAFLQQFFDEKGAFRSVTYEEHQAQLLSQDPAGAIVRRHLVAAVDDLKKFADLAPDGTVLRVNERAFLKG